MNCRIRPWWHVPAAALAAVGGVLATGCGPAVGSVTGTVRFQGRPVVEGYVMLVPANGDYRQATSSLVRDGRYTAANVTTGEKTVTLMDARFSRDDGSTESMPADVQLNPAAAVVRPGPQVIDIEAVPAAR